MFNRLSGQASPISKPPASSNSGVKSKSQSLGLCSAALPNLAAAKTAPEARSTQGELLPPEIVVSILNGFATSLLVEKDRFELLKSKCLEGAKLGHDDDAATGSILKSSHTVLTYLTWGIRHIEKASTCLQKGEKESIEEHLKNAEQMLKSLIDSIQLELNNNPTTILSSVRVPNASFILGLAHVFLALVCKLRKSTSNLIASHLLEAFIVSPNNARQNFIPQLWNQLFRPHLSAVEAWYKKEHANIVSSFSRSPSVSADSKPCSPKIAHTLTSPRAANSVVSRANSLLDLVSGMRLSKRGNMMHIQHDQAKLLERMNMQVKLLSDLYEQSLDEGTIQYARRYQDLIVNYYGRFSCDRDSGTWKLLQNENTKVEVHHRMAGNEIGNEAVASTIKEAAAPDICTEVDDDDEVDGKLTSGRGWTGTNALQLRRSLFDAVFGTVPNNKTSKQDRSYTSPSSPISSLLRLCNKDFPKVIDPLRSKEETDACTPAANYEKIIGTSYASGKATTIRDVVNTASSPMLQELDTLNKRSKVKAAMRGHNQSAETLNENYLLTPDPESSSSMTSHVPTELPPPSCKKDYVQTTCEQVGAVSHSAHSKRLIDFIKDNDNQSDTNKYSTIPSHKVANRVTRSCQTKMAASDSSMEGTKVEGQRIMKRSNSESSKKNQTSGWMASADQDLKSQIKSSRRVGGRSNVTALAKMASAKQNVVYDGKTEDVQVKYCTSLQVRETRPLSIKNSKDQFSECTSIDNAVQASSIIEAEVWGAGTRAQKSISNQLEELANELRAAVQSTQSSNNMLEGVGRCEEVLLRLSQAWLECKSATLLRRKGIKEKEPDSVTGNWEVLQILDGLTHELLFILANSELQEAQRLALCLLSASIGPKESNSNESAPLVQLNYDAKTRGEVNKSTRNQLPSDPNVLHALLHLLQQQGRLPEAALLLHLLHPAQYSASCHHFLPHLLPLLLDLAQRNGLPRTQNASNYIASSCRRPFDGRLHLIAEAKPRTLALMMMSRLLAAVDTHTRLQACKHVLFPNVNALPCLLHSLDCAPSVDERIASAFVLTTCMHADDICKHHIVNHVKLPSVVALLQQSASNSNAFQTAVNFVTELLRTRKARIREMLSCLHRDGLLNCMHALMAYLQTASLENQPPAAGLLLQLDLLLGDEERYSVFREEALEALLSPFLTECSREATFNAAHVLSTLGRSESEQELEAWLLKKAGLGATLQEKNLNTSNQCYMSSTANHIAPASKQGQEQEEDEEGTMVAEWDKRVACAIIEQGGGRLVSNALAKGMQSSMAEVKKACLLVAAWLTSHLSSMYPFDQHHSAHHRFTRASTKGRMRETLQAQLQEIAAVGSGNAIVERVFAALALQNLAR
ncbi:hypothetical protein GOP47_0010570 [Adiantum capillus-veneris]|uniref:Uncharacterized protein n=1 Tax=Adiantum capillus-veneris TaxID=13818 RepID=A0A9D4UVJ9_ADICA|nr:hypothetical protein GOP47_0010570 [Adiantum capillus-veneris]